MTRRGRRVSTFENELRQPVSAHPTLESKSSKQQLRQQYQQDNGDGGGSNDEHSEGETVIPSGGVGLASNPNSEKAAIRRGRMEGKREARFPKVNLLRDGPLQPEGLRQSKLEAGSLLRVSDEKLEENDFLPDYPGTSEGARRVEAAMLKQNSQSTVALEKSFMASFLSATRDFLTRYETACGVYMLQDFVHSFVQASDRSTLMAQLSLIRSHIGNGVLSRAFSDLGDSRNRWCVDLVDMLDSIVNDSNLLLEQMVSACNITVTRLGTFYAKRACGCEYPTSDQVMKCVTFFCRVLVALLGLAQTLGCYSVGVVSRRNRTMPAGHAASNVPDEISDYDFMLSLQDALESSRDVVSPSAHGGLEVDERGRSGGDEEEEDVPDDDEIDDQRQDFRSRVTTYDPFRPRRTRNLW